LRSDLEALGNQEALNAIDTVLKKHKIACIEANIIMFKSLRLCIA